MIKLDHKRIGNYLMFTNKKVAQLKYSNIFMGVNTLNKKKVLIKTISKTEYQKNDVLMNSFNFELKTMKVLKDENILQSIELIMTQKNYYQILQQPQGTSFKKVLQKKGRLSQKQIRGYLIKIKSTLEALQKNKIIHGNINSKSILIDHNQVKFGYPSYVKTIEVMKKNALHETEFKMGDNLEKQKDYAYLPPELLSTGMISLKHDIWSLGVVIYEGLFGQLPWNLVKCNEPIQMACLILNQQINFPTDIQVSKQMKHLLVNCLDSNPYTRFGWEQALQHTVFNKDNDVQLQRNIYEQEASRHENQGCSSYQGQKMLSMNSALTQ